MNNSVQHLVLLTLLASLLTACSDSSDKVTANNLPANNTPQVIPPDPDSVFAVAKQCYAIAIGEEGNFVSTSAAGYELIATDAAQASHFLLQPADLGVYLLYDESRNYLTSDGVMLTRQLSLLSDISEVEGSIVIQDRLQSEGEWELRAAADGKFNLHHLKSGNHLTEAGRMGDATEAADVELVAANTCTDFPELSVNASGDISTTEFEDGSVFGFVDAHSHLFTNFAFGGGGVFHGAPFHRLGVEHALHDCEQSHGVDGRKDFMGSSFNGTGSLTDLLPALIAGELPVKDHDTRGFPDFTSWPNAPSSATHQVQYYQWLKRAYLSGLRLVVQHATTNELLCQLVVGVGAQPQRFDCNDMISVDRILEETYALERYIDALSGGPGQGWFRIVFSPQEAREQIKAGKLAVILGIETSDLFDCFLVPFEGFERCTQSDVVAKLDQYHAKGVRAIFPVHKYDNAFSAGDGDRGIIEVGNFLHTGYFGNLVKCDESLLGFPGGFDSGGLSFTSLNMPREVFDSAPPIDMSGFADDVIGHLLANIGLFLSPPEAGDYCQNAGLTDLGKFLVRQLMARGMIIEVDHLPRPSYAQAYEILVDNDYPAMGTHGRNNNGLLYELGGMSKSNLGRCRSETTEGTMDDSFQTRIQLMREKGAFPAEGFGFDLNGFAGAPGPRFGANSVCAEEQLDEGITYPFTSYAGDVTLEQPVIGNRVLDFNTEGMVHLGLVAEVIEDVRADGATDEDLQPLFKSAEGYLRMWEKSEARGAILSNSSN
ncbi:MAG: hypothetical protein ACI9A2_003765 [Halioglobus sp.]|jgi:hypothetical protein